MLGGPLESGMAHRDGGTRALSGMMRIGVVENAGRRGAQHTRG